ncbi:hypothetical protein BURPS668_0205 [Burkholderia pseudomallei 668]|nr:hypothetical protein BURPS668_0205 [Burkholderia pseudomallei 668]
MTADRDDGEIGNDAPALQHADASFIASQHRKAIGKRK